MAPIKNTACGSGIVYTKKLKHENELGILYRSVRHPGGQCVAVLRPPALTPPAIQAGHYQFHWDGNAITHILSVAEKL